MHDFHYLDNELYCEDVPIRKIAGSVGTPFYLYSNHTLENKKIPFPNGLSGKRIMPNSTPTEGAGISRSNEINAWRFMAFSNVGNRCCPAAG